MVDDLVGQLGTVWTPWRVLLGIGFGFGFGYLVIASIVAQPRWRTENSRRALAWLVGVLAAWFMTGLAFLEAIGSALDGDPGWVRVVSRIFPQLLVSVAVALGVYRGLYRAGNQ